MSYIKKYLSILVALFVALCFFTFEAYAEYNPSKAIDDTLGILKQGGLNFIHNNYCLSIFIVLLVTFGFDIDYYVKNGIKIHFLRFTTTVALIGIFICTVIKIFY